MGFPFADVPDEFFEPPDIAVEIVARSARGVPTDDVSPEQSVRSQVRKCQWYVEHAANAGSLGSWAGAPSIRMPCRRRCGR